MTTDFQRHQAAAYLRLACTYRDMGRDDLAETFEAKADALGATCPHCGGDLVGAFPVTGHETDMPPGEALTPAQQIVKQEHARSALDIT